MTETPQERFDSIYVTSSEICHSLGITRPTVLAARARGLLPSPIAVNGGMLFIWERATVQPYLDAWRIILNARRNNHT